MFSKTIKYTDFNGQPQEKVFWFHLSNAKLALIAAGGDLNTWVQKVTTSKDNIAILEKLRELIKMSCGIRSEDGQRFIQTEDAQSELLDSPAFDELLFELFVGKNAVDFFSALVPPEQQKQIQELAEKQGLNPAELPSQAVLEDPMPAYQKERRRPTSDELQKMSKEEMVEAFRWTEQNGVR